LARRYSWLVLIVLLLVGVFVVMRVLRTGGGLPPAGQDSPQAVLRKLQRAIAEGDRAEFLECFGARHANHKAAEEDLFDYVEAAGKLRDTLRGAYGKNAWDTFVSAQANPAQFTAFLWPRDEDVAAAAAVAIQGNEARVELPPREPFTLKLEGVWRIEIFPHGSGVRAQREALAKATEALRRARGDVGRPGATPESIGQNVRKQLGGATE